MSHQGPFKKTISLLDLILIGLGAIFGSAWLFAVSNVASKAGPIGSLSWVIGGIIVLLIGLVYEELGAALPRTGGILRYPVYSHGPLVGYLISFITIVAYTSLISIEVTAVRQYIAYWLPGLTIKGSDSPTIAGWLVQFSLLCLFFLLNYWSVKTFAKSNIIISIFKYFVPLTIIVVLAFHFKAENFSVGGFAPFGVQGIQAAISTGGVMFAYNCICSRRSQKSTAQHTYRFNRLHCSCSDYLYSPSSVVYRQYSYKHAFRWLGENSN